MYQTCIIVFSVVVSKAISFFYVYKIFGCLVPCPERKVFTSNIGCPFSTPRLKSHPCHCKFLSDAQNVGYFETSRLSAENVKKECNGHPRQVQQICNFTYHYGGMGEANTSFKRNT